MRSTSVHKSVNAKPRKKKKIIIIISYQKRCASVCKSVKTKPHT